MSAVAFGAYESKIVKEEQSLIVKWLFKMPMNKRRPLKQWPSRKLSIQSAFRYFCEDDNIEIVEVLFEIYHELKSEINKPTFFKRLFYHNVKDVVNWLTTTTDCTQEILNDLIYGQFVKDATINQISWVNQNIDLDVMSSITYHFYSSAIIPKSFYDDDNLSIRGCAEDYYDDYHDYHMTVKNISIRNQLLLNSIDNTDDDGKVYEWIRTHIHGLDYGVVKYYIPLMLELLGLLEHDDDHISASIIEHIKSINVVKC